ncbi:putative NAPE-hydrolyzing phospholipase D [Emericellopsis cladophorae]|uniref:NAPE-hydrolyzing phospholipase D n=1 Tax=Emericellopsis cladophorae TaxID=2686198 RepID=A0A9Q0BFK2_9HYPO|nr:putative NAPE-hydrolyzing phospholipase D [Emericellopsis cladophorae]KAI6783562.1 putative NAPE-hydrolyzing phospholipase D [Emericellopsis cladophorae]
MTTSAPVTKVTNVANALVPDQEKARPHHVVKNGRITGFKNPYPSYRPLEPMKHIFIPILTGKMKFPTVPDPLPIPLVKPTFLPSRDTPKLRATWLGHAAYYVEFPSGLRVLFDPVFEKSCSPFPLDLFSNKRITPAPASAADLPYVDAVVISHSHYDHLSHPTSLEVQKHFPHAHFFVPLGLEKWFRSSGTANVTEMDWWEDVNVHITVPQVNNDESSSQKPLTATFSCLPAQHTSARTPFDRDTTLWASWAVSSGGSSVFFGGDTGYRAVPGHSVDEDDYSPTHDHLPRNPQFKMIGYHKGPFDLGLIPIGAYSPRASFSPVHANPYDAVEIFLDTACKRAIGIHWGTWLLTTEPVMEPPELLRKALARREVPEEGVFDVCGLGESREF